MYYINVVNYDVFILKEPRKSPEDHPDEGPKGDMPSMPVQPVESESPEPDSTTTPTVPIQREDSESAISTPVAVSNYPVRYTPCVI